MSLSAKQMADTRHELMLAMKKAGQTIESLAAHYHTSQAYIHRVLDLNSGVLEDPWIVKEYLNDLITQQGGTPITFTALKGDYRNYWFLDVERIAKQQLGS